MKKPDLLDALTLLCISAIAWRQDERRADSFTTRWLRARRSRQRMSNLKSGVAALVEAMRTRH